MGADRFDIHYIADLARIALTPEEEQQLGAQLSSILDYVEQLRGVDVSGVDPTAHPFPMVNVWRADEPRPCLPHDQAMKNAPRKASGLFMVPRIVE
jgi:aspartyl-tRNA(Asn)/glutamyl-tRNA(Gln) amidotransferase subunit C